MQNHRLTAVGVGLAIALFLAVNLLAGPTLRGVRADLTEQKLYTLSEGTRNILSDLDESITLRYFFARKVAAEQAPAILPYADRVLEMLEQYALASKGKVTLEVIDPEPFSEEEELAVGYGIQGRRVSMEGDKLYIGLVGTNSVDDEEVVPVLEPGREGTLEYELTQLIDRLENPELPVLGLVTSLPLRGGTLPPANEFSQPQRQEPWPILQLVEQRYQIRDLDPATMTEVPDEVDILLLVQPKDLTDAGRYAIDQYALRGGKVCAFVDPAVFFAAEPPPAMGAAADMTGIDALLKGWGVGLRPDAVAGDEATSRPFPTQRGTFVPSPLFMDVLEEGLDQDDILTRSLSAMTLLMPGAVDVTPIDGLEVTPLLRTTASGGTVGRSLVAQQIDVETVVASFVEAGEPLTLGVRVRGRAKSLFPGGLDGDDDAAAEPEEADQEGDASESEEAATEASHLDESTAPFNAIVVADVDMLHVQLWARQLQSLFGGTSYSAANGNAHLLINALENLSGSDDLIGLRSRADYRRPFLVKEELEREAREEYDAERRELEAKLQEAERRINERLADQDPSSGLLISPEIEEEIANIRKEEAETRGELRRVQRSLTARIDALGTRLELLNIFLVPAILLALLATVTLARRGKARA